MLGGSTLTYSLYIRLGAAWQRIGLLYLSWIVLAAIPAFLMVAALAGVSMAGVDGAVDHIQLTLMELESTARLLAAGRVFIIPYVALVGFLLEKLRTGD